MLNDDYQSILLKAVADRLAEAGAERLHRLVRTELWGTSPEEQIDNEPDCGKVCGHTACTRYPACPDHTTKQTLFELIEATKHTGVGLTESMAMMPAASVSGWMFATRNRVFWGGTNRTRSSEGLRRAVEPRGRNRRAVVVAKFGLRSGRGYRNALCHELLQVLGRPTCPTRNQHHVLRTVFRARKMHQLWFL